MGKTVVFWTSKREFGDTNGIMAAVACQLGITEEKKVAVTSLPGQASAFLELFDIRIPEKIRAGRDNGIGFYPLLQRALYEKPGEKMIMDTGVHTINRGPLLYPWFDEDQSLLTEKNAVTLIMGGIKECFDFVLVDAGSGTLQEYAELLLKNADIVVVLLPQNKRRWKEYFEGNPLNGTGRFIYVIYPYVSDSAYGEKWFSHHFGRDSMRVNGVPACSAFTDACAEGRVAEIFLEAGNNKKRRTSQFFKSIRKVAKGISDR